MPPTAPKWHAPTASLLTLTGVAGIGVLAWQDAPGRLLLLLLLPACMNVIRWRWWPFAVAATYFLAGNVDLPAMIARFYDPAPGAAYRWGATLLLTACQSSPFLLYRADASPFGRAWRMALALLLLTLPGIGFLAWRNPLFVAGLLYPAQGVMGLVFALGLFTVLASGGRTKTGIMMGLACVGLSVGSILHDGDGGARRGMGYPGWYAIDTQIPPESHRDPWRVRTTLPGDVIASESTKAMQVGADVVVFPESILAPGTLADQVVMLSAEAKARRSGVVLLVGQTEPMHPEYGAPAWRNTLRAYGAMTGIVSESRIPMPMGNWRLQGGVTAHPFAPDVIALHTRSGLRHVAISICYEDLLLWPHLGLLTGKADMLVSVGNTWATQHTRADTAQRISASMLARLAGVPLVRATNTWSHRND